MSKPFKEKILQEFQEEKHILFRDQNEARELIAKSINATLSEVEKKMGEEIEITKRDKNNRDCSDRCFKMGYNKRAEKDKQIIKSIKEMKDE